VDPDSDGSLPVDKIAAMLAVQCLVRGQAPEDYELMIISQKSPVHYVVERAQQLLSAGRALGTGVNVSSREREVLDFILQYFTNKEIASRIHVSERTVKFHVSSLLAKFGVTNRMALIREVPLRGMRSSISTDQIQLQTLFNHVIQGRDAKSQNGPPSEPCPTAAQSARSSRRVAPMISNARLVN